jgi:uncharacterized protein YdaU (DUF1376 family)
MNQPWFRFFPNDWLSGVAGLSAAERGVYVTLLALMYDASGPIFRDDGRLARRCGLPKAGFKRALDSLIADGKVSNDCGFLFNERAKNELTERENRKLTASKGAASLHKKNKQKQSYFSGDAASEQAPSSATRARVSHSHISSSNEEDKARKTRRPPSDDEIEVLSILTECVSDQTAADIVKHRTKLKSALTPGSARGLVKLWKKHGDCEAAASAQMANGWKGFNPDWMTEWVWRYCNGYLWGWEWKTERR